MQHRQTLFISYSHNDRWQINDIVDCLRAGGYDPWLDYSLIPGQDWKNQLSDLIKKSDVFVYTLTSASLSSEWCQWELREAAKMQKPIIPVVLQPNLTLPEEIKILQWVDLSDGLTSISIAKLMYGLRTAGTIPKTLIPNAPQDPKGTPVEALNSSELQAPQKTQSTNITELSREFNFTVEELELNRKGRKSKRQIQTSSLSATIWLTLLTLSGVITTGVFFAAGNTYTLIAIMTAFLTLASGTLAIFMRFIGFPVRSTVGTIEAADLNSITVNGLRLNTVLRPSVFPTKNNISLIFYYCNKWGESRQLLSAEPKHSIT